MWRRWWAEWKEVFQLLWYGFLTVGYPMVFFSGFALGYCSTEFKMPDMPVDVVRRIASDDLREESLKKFCFEPGYAVEVSAYPADPPAGGWGSVKYVIAKKGFEGADLDVDVYPDTDRKYFPNEKLNSVVERLRREGSCGRQ